MKDTYIINASITTRSIMNISIISIIISISIVTYLHV
jgi:hypothetical protein